MLKKNLTRYNYYNSNLNGVILAGNMKTVLKIGINSRLKILVLFFWLLVRCFRCKLFNERGL